MLHDLVFLPVPRHLTLSGTTFELPSTWVICVETPLFQDNLLAAQQLQETVNALPDVHWELVGGAALFPQSDTRRV